jgi:hypothetical protein
VDPDELAPLSLFRFDSLRLSWGLDLWEPLEELLVPEVSSKASLFDTFLGVSSPEVSVSDVSAQLTGL